MTTTISTSSAHTESSPPLIDLDYFTDPQNWPALLDEDNHELQEKFGVYIYWRERAVLPKNMDQVNHDLYIQKRIHSAKKGIRVYLHETERLNVDTEAFKGHTKSLCSEVLPS